ncbi:MAG: DUF4143 domain-containing protein [Erysipelotrichales bacterium]|nr:DUF4143 domain-containing protein [Erysipelotrichales bacterium]
MKVKNYYPRIIDDELDLHLEAMGAVFIRGPKWCGKTTTAFNHAKSYINFQDTAKGDSYISLAQTDPSVLLEGKTPKLIDEWQIVPKIWNAIRTTIDNRGLRGQFIITGSTLIKNTEGLHPGTGRISKLDMRTMSLFESNESTGEISLNDLMNDIWKDGLYESDLSLKQLAFSLCRGGWPSALNISEKAALMVSKQYLKATIENDISELGETKNPLLARHIMQSYSRLISSSGSNSALYADVQSNFGSVTDKTINNYLSLLERLFIIDEIPAWNLNFRSATAIRSSKKKSFIDPSLATAALDLSPEQLLYDFETFGLLFENLVTRDLLVYTQSKGGHVKYYRDRYGLECDCVIHLDNGNYGLFEVKLGENKIEEAAKNLIKLEGLIKDNNMRKPTCKVIITGGKAAYKRVDGIYVIPIGCLKD